MSSLTPETPSFDIRSILGFKASGTYPVANVLQKKMLEEQKHLECSIEEHSWLKKGHPLGDEVAEKKLADLGLSGLLRFGGGGPFGGVLKERDIAPIGQDPLIFMSDFLELLLGNESLLDEWGIDKNELDRLRNGLQSSREIAEELNRIRTSDEGNLEEQISDFAAQLKDRLEADKVVYFPVMNGEGKYSQVVRVDKDHGFSIIEVNGIHSPYLTGLESAMNLESQDDRERQDLVRQVSLDPLTGKRTETFKTQQFISFEAKNKERLGDLEFFEALIKNSVIESENSRKMIFQSLPKYVDGKRLKASDTENAFYRKVYRYFDSQDKDPSFQSISALLYYMSLDPFFGSDKDCTEAVKRYKKIKFLLQTQLFFAYVKKIEDDSAWNNVSEEEKIFLKDLLTNLVRSAGKLKEKKAITEEQLEAFFASIQQLKGILSRPVQMEEVSSLEDQEVLARALLWERIEPKFKDEEDLGPIHLPQKMHMIGLDDDSNLPQSQKQAKETPAENMIRGLAELNDALDFSEDVEDKQEQIDSLRENLKLLQDQYRKLKADPMLSYRSGTSIFSQSASEAERRAVFDQFDRSLGDAIAMLPAPERGDHGFWGTLTEQQAEECFQIMEEFSILIQSFATLETRCKPRFRESFQGHSPETTLMMLMLQALQLKLASKSPKYGVEEGAFSYLPFLMEMRSIHFVVKHHGLRKQIHPFMRYFDKKWNIEELTRSMEKSDLISDTQALFSFSEHAEHYVQPFQMKLSNESKGKTQDQLYLEKMLEVNGVREGVLEIIKHKNERYDKEHENNIERYERDLTRYQTDKANFERQKRDKKGEIERTKERHDRNLDAIAPRNVRTKLGRLRNLHSARQRFSIAQEITQEERNLFDELKSNFTEPYAVAEQLHRAEGEMENELRPLNQALSEIEDRLGFLRKPVEPVHPGHFPTDSVVDQLACLLFDQEGRRLIPKEMDAVIQAMLRNRYLILEDSVGFDLKDKGIKFQFIANWSPLPLDAQNKRTSITAKVAFTGLDGNNPRGVDSEILRDCPQDFKRNLRRSPAFQSNNWMDERSLATLIEEERERKMTQNEAMVSRAEFFGLDIGLSRELRMLAIDPYDTVSRTIGFLGKNMDLIKNPAIQEYVRVLLFRPDRIHTQLRDNPELTHKINAFIRAAVTHYKELHDIDTCLAMIRLGEQFKHAASEINGNDRGFSDFRDVILNELIPSFSKDRAAQLKAYRTLVLFHADDKVVDREAIIRDLLSLRVSRNLQSESVFVSRQDEATERAALLKYQHLLKEDLSDENLTYAIKIADSEADLDEHAIWKNHGEGNFSCDKYEINIYTGLVTIEGKPIVTTPNWITDNEMIRRVYPHSFSSDMCKKRNDWTYTLFPNKKEQVTVSSYDNGTTVEMTRLIDGKNYRYVPTPQNLIEKMPTIFNEDVICWVSDSGKLLVFKDGKKAYTIDFDGKGEVEKITRSKDGAVKRSLSDFSEFFTPLALLEQDLRYIECWESPDGRKTTAEFKRLGLSFDFKMEELASKGMEFARKQEQLRQLSENIVGNKDNEIERAKLSIEIFDLFPVHCQNFPGFSLTLPILVQSLDSKVPFVTLINGSGERKILVPKSDDGQLSLSDDPLEWYEFDVDKVQSDGITSFDIASSSIELQLLQVMMLAKKKDFSKIKKLIEKLNPLGALTKEEVKLLDAAMAILSKYNHPESNALVVKMLLVKEVNNLKYPKIKAAEEEAPVEEIPDNIWELFNDEMLYIAAYDKYRESSSDAAMFQLSDEEERKFVEILHKKLREKFDLMNKVQSSEDLSGNFFNQMIDKAQSWFKTRMLPTLSMGILEKRIGDRYHDLSKQEGKLGSRKVTLPSLPNLQQLQNADQIKPIPSEEDIQKLFLQTLGEDGISLEIPFSGQIGDCLNVLSKNEAYWKENFLILYYTARSGTDEQKAKLQKAVDLATHLNTGEHRLIQMVLAKPGRYPTLEKLNGIIREWRVEGQEKLKNARENAALKTQASWQADNDCDQKQEEYDQLELEERDLVENAEFYYEASRSGGLFERIGKAFRWLIACTSENRREAFPFKERIRVLHKCKQLAEKARKAAQKRLNNDAYTGYWTVYDKQNDERVVFSTEEKIGDIESRITRCRELSPKLQDAGKALKISEAARIQAEKESIEATKQLGEAENFIEQMEAKFKATVVSILPGNLWKVIEHVVKPIFNTLSAAWNLYWQGKKFLYKHDYKVRDIFSNGQTSRSRQALDVNRSELQEIDRVFNDYFKGLVDEYFNVALSDEEGSPDWNVDNEDDPLVKSKLGAEKAALDEYRKEVRKPREHAELKADKDLKDLLEELAEKEQMLNVSLTHQKQVLLWQLNRAVDSNEQAKLKVLLNRAGQKGDLTWDDLRALTLEGDWKIFQEKTGLDDAEAKMLMKAVADYLIKSTRLNQIRFVIGKVQKGLSAKSEAKRKIYYTNILEAMRLERHYLKGENTLLSRKDMGRLWFEYANGYLYREQQILTLDKTGEMTDPEILMEAPTGFGKSKNYVPTRDHEMAGEHLVLNVHPRTIEQINAEDILAQMKNSFGGKADRFHFQRSSEFTVQTLRTLYEELQVNFEEGRPINFSAETLQALELHFLMSLYDYKQQDKSGNFSEADKAEAREEITYFIRILRAISVYGWATIDESHVNLNPFTNKLIYTIGESTTLETYQVDILEEMMRLMVTDLEISKIAQVAENKQAKITDEQYRRIADRLAESFAEKFSLENNRDEFLNFVCGRTDEVPRWIRKHPSAKRMALIKGMLSLILKSSMQGYVDESYGLSILHFDKGKEYAIAYASSNTPKENETSPSQFKNPHETMVKTYLTYLHKGLKEEQVVKMIKKMQSEQRMEAQTTGSLSSTRANEAFRIIAGNGYSLQQLKEEDMRKLFPVFQRNQDAIFYYVRNIIVPQLRLYEKTLVSTPQNLRSMFGSSLSLSATPQDPATLGPDTAWVPMKGTQGQVLHLFLKKVNNSSKIHQAGGSNPEEVLDSAIETVLNKDHIKCIIDAGGLLRGLSNTFVAERLQNRIKETGSPIEAIQYFDVDQEKFVVMEVSTGTLSDPKVAKMDPAKMITIFDQPRCFGSDTVQDETASALLLVNNNKDGSCSTDKNKAGQGAGRMRQWHLDQGMEVMMTPEDYRSLFDGKEANIGDLLNQWVGSLAKQEAKENYQALLQQMDNELRSPAIHRMLGVKTGDRGEGQKDTIRDVDPDVDKALRLFSKFESLLVTDDSIDPWALYAEMATDKSPEEALDDHLKRTKARASKMGGFSRSQRRILKNRLGRYSRKWKASDANERVTLPDRVKSSKVDTGTQVEVQVQAEQQVEVQAEEQRWNQLTLRTPSRWSERIKLFEPGWEKPYRKSIFFSRLANSLSKLEPKNLVAKILFRAGLVVAGTALAATAAAVFGVAWPIIVSVGSGLLVAGLVFVAYRAFAGRNVKYVSNCSYKVSDVMGIHLPKRAKRGARFFSPGLTASNNYYAQYTPSWRQSQQKPFDQEQKPVFNVLVIQDEDKKGRKKLQMMLIDQNDSVYFRRRLQDDYEQTSAEDAAERKRKIAVYDVTNKTVAVQGANHFDEDELEKNPQFIQLLTQAKVVNGEIHYTEDEKGVIAERAQNVGADYMAQFARDFILAEHPIRKQLFQYSDFQHALEVV
ncbi:putative uncharacterized protein [Waddlia chondrophila 2032/99]|uniref:Uncharacterized protein n=1 Tax=Waddlia chondrophila 2032/99 TaxID=765953 RepID=F8LF38_9BACT|nr:putative uncharacterized protein [Waddlia chondrophila 2032/99]